MTEELKVCQIVGSFRPVVGGVERATETLAKKLQSRGLDLVIITRRYPGLPRFERFDGLPVHRLGLPGTSKLAALSFAVHALWLLATRFREFRLIHVQNIDTPLLVGLVAKRVMDRALVATIHGEAKIQEKRETLPGRIRLEAMRRLVDAYGALTPTMREELLKEGVCASRIQVIPNGVDTDVFRPPSALEKKQARHRLGLDESGVVTLFAGRLIPLKRADALLRAWAQLPRENPYMLLIVGDGPDRESLEDLCSDLELDNVRFEGLTHEMVSYFHAADVFVLPSEREGLSLALLEAMACGLCVVATDLEGQRDLLAADQNALLVPPGGVNTLSEALSRALRSRKTRLGLGRRAVETIQVQASVRAVVEAHVALYGAVHDSSEGLTVFEEEGLVGRSDSNVSSTHTDVARDNCTEHESKAMPRISGLADA